MIACKKSIQFLAVDRRHNHRRIGGVHVVDRCRTKLPAKRIGKTSRRLKRPEVVDVFAGKRILARQNWIPVAVEPGPKISGLPINVEGVVVSGQLRRDLDDFCGASRPPPRSVRGRRACRVEVPASSPSGSGAS